MAVWNSKAQREPWWKDEKLLRTSGFYQKLEAEARFVANHYKSHIMAWRALYPLLEHFADDETALIAIRKGFNTSLLNGGWEHLPDYAEVHNPFPTRGKLI